MAQCTCFTKGKITFQCDHQAMVDLSDFFLRDFLVRALLWTSKNKPNPSLLGSSSMYDAYARDIRETTGAAKSAVVEKLRQIRYAAEHASARLSEANEFVCVTHDQAVIVQLNYFPRWLQLVFFSINFSLHLVFLLQTTSEKAGNDKCMAYDNVGVGTLCGSAMFVATTHLLPDVIV